MSTEYNRQQIIYSLNSIANAPSGRHGTVAELEQYATEVITEVLADSRVIGLIGQWQLVWGPAVYQVTGSTVADNAMYVAQSKTDKSQFVVAISGTNPISAYGWIVEDIVINPPVNWPYGTAGAAAGQITHGTSVGLNVLLNILKGGDNTLHQYLAGQVSNSGSALTITVTGHSLGGALSPSVALALLDTEGLPLTDPNGWDPDSKSQIAVEPTAGPTPGNATWADYYGYRLGSATDRLWNRIDIVPHAWQISMLKEVPNIYEPTIPENELVQSLVGLAIANSKAFGDAEQIRPDVPGLPGQIDPNIELSIKEMLVILETLLANDLIDKLTKDLPESVRKWIKEAIDALINWLNGETNKAAEVDLDKLMAVSAPRFAAMESEYPGITSLIRSFLNFLIQAAYQHTTEYAKLIGTTAFHAIVEAIEESIGSE